MSNASKTEILEMTKKGRLRDYNNLPKEKQMQIPTIPQKLEEAKNMKEVLEIWRKIQGV